MDSKRDLDGEKRLIRNEKARRRRALQYACRYLPIELEKKIFNYMKNPRNGRIDVSMKWQKHPVAKIISQYTFNLFNDVLPRRQPYHYVRERLHQPFKPRLYLSGHSYLHLLYPMEIMSYDRL